MKMTVRLNFEAALDLTNLAELMKLRNGTLNKLQKLFLEELWL